MADDYFTESYHPASRRHAILQLDGTVAYLYLTAAGTQSLQRDVAVFSTGELVDAATAIAATRAGDPPPLVAEYATPEAVRPAQTFWGLRFLWSDDGESVAVLLGALPLAYVSGQESRGRSRALSATSFFGEPWDELAYRRRFGRDAEAGCRVT